MQQLHLMTVVVLELEEIQEQELIPVQVEILDQVETQEPLQEEIQPLKLLLLQLEMMDHKLLQLLAVIMQEILQLLQVQMMVLPP